MAELAKKLHFLKNGTEQTAKAYSTVDEAGDNYAPLKIDGVACYAPLGATDDAMATNGRVKKNGTTYAIKSQSKPPYTEISYTTAGTHTFTVPAGITRLRVAVCGGGGGGCAYAAGLGQTISAGAGGTSSFGNLIQATGGGGGWNDCYDPGGDYAIIRNGYQGAGGTPNGNTNSGSTGTGAAGFALSFTKTTGTYGKGGNTNGTLINLAIKNGTNMAGGSGGYNTGYVSVNPNTTYTITVGAGGTAKYYNIQAYDGESGFVLIAYGGDM